MKEEKRKRKKVGTMRGILTGDINVSTMDGGLKVVIPHTPVPQQRHRMVRRGSFMVAYDPLAKEKEALRSSLTGASTSSSLKMTGGLTCEIEFHMSIPKSTSMKLLDQMDTGDHIKKPDIDNLIKFYLDTLNGIIYEDDSVIHTIKATKKYSKNPRVEITFKNKNDRP